MVSLSPSFRGVSCLFVVGFALTIACFSAAPLSAAGNNNNNNNNNYERDRRQREANARAKAAQQAQQAKETISQKQSENANAANVKAAAEQQASKAQAKLADAEADTSAARSSVEGSTKAVADARKQIDDIELKIISGESAKSPYALAKDRRDRARDVLNKARERVLSSPEYKSRYSEARVSTEPAARMAAVRSEALSGDADYAAAEAAFQTQETIFNQLELELFAANADWVAATAALRQLLPTIADDKDKLLTSSLQHATAKNSLASASNTAASATAAIRANEAAIQDAQKKLDSATKKKGSKEKDKNSSSSKK